MARVERTVLAQTARNQSDSLATTGLRSTPVLLSGIVGVQLTGGATSVTAFVERSTEDPAGTPNWAPADTNPIQGNPAAGIPPIAYREPGAAWWSVRVTALTGTPLNVSVMGKGA